MSGKRRFVEHVLVGGQVLRAHHPDDCLVTPCCLHSPSDHHMVDWPQNWRSDRYLMERICPHGVGHPDPDAIFDFGEGVHGCDGCCHPPDDKVLVDV